MWNTFRYACELFVVPDLCKDLHCRSKQSHLRRCLQEAGETIRFDVHLAKAMSWYFTKAPDLYGTIQHEVSDLSYC